MTVPSGEARYLYLDSDYFLPIKGVTKTTIQGQEVEISSMFGDYKEVDGLILAHSMEQVQPGPQGQAKTVFTVDSVEVNVEIPDDQFTMPAAGGE